MATTIDGVKTLQIRNAENGDFDLNFARVCDCSYLENAILNAYPTENETGNPIYFDDGADSVPVKELIVNLEPKQEGSGDPSPTNVRPISGYDGVTVKRTGKNLLKFDNSNNANRTSFTYSSATDESIIGVKNNTGGVFFARYEMSMTEGTEYSFHFDSFTIADSASSMHLYIYSDKLWGTVIKDIFIGANGVSWVSPFTGNAVLGVFVNAHQNDTIQLLKFSASLASASDSTFEPYTGQEYSVTFPSNVGTVYGGKLNVTTGLLTIDRYNLWLDPTKIPDNYIHFDVLTNNARIGNLILSTHFGLTSAYNAKYSSEATFRNGALSNWSVEKNKGYSSDTSGFYFSGADRFYLFCPKSIFATQDAIGFKQYLTDNPLYICYELATPTTVQLTPTEVSTLLGSNTISSDGSINLTYRADTTKVIEKLTNAIISLGGNV